MAEEKPYLTGRTYIFRLPKGKDLLESLADFCHDNQVKCGVVTVIGSVENATLGWYDQSKKRYEKTVVNAQMELLSLTGNISIQDNRPQVHAHAMLTGKGDLPVSISLRVRYGLISLPSFLLWLSTFLNFRGMLLS